MDFEKSHKEILKALAELIEDNQIIPVIVEGDKDINALKKLGLKGIITSCNKGVPLIDFCDKIAEGFTEIIILTDWDRKGGFLCHTIEKYLEGRVKCNLHYREIFAKNTIVKTIEGLPSWIETIEKTKV